AAGVQGGGGGRELRDRAGAPEQRLRGEASDHGTEAAGRPRGRVPGVFGSPGRESGSRDEIQRYPPPQDASRDRGRGGGGEKTLFRASRVLLAGSGRDAAPRARFSKEHPVA